MKIIYEFNPYNYDGNDRFELSLVQHGYKMYQSLNDIKEHIKQYNKGYLEDDIDKILDAISEFIVDSGVYEIDE